MAKALVIIDIQNDYFPGGAFELENAEQALQKALEAIHDARADGTFIVAIQHIATPDAPFFKPLTDGVKIHHAIAEAIGSAPVIVKAQADSFLNTSLEELLREQGITELLLAGMMTQHCVTHTALSPQASDFEISILGAACAAPSQMLSNLALSGLGARFTVL